ncbi:sensor domain-containing diguanylate cyclase [Paenibacillus sp. TRM 82003]|uniref:GGDEF domain-containing protein n=1 Tax=Kineococcus sp. TRM81007 TaxID=2925831 RepID=UPI001F56329A|nr:sensor domain-containing diguanylate cyclase [Kineococcus sp. TRM81007]MCI2237827.1 sensor domain-containing diguanylate cyclase [Kineococcus sp. TRM81007]MCI3926646.1 sensor domain-containing diguanylate cyclase [Paenibacillus sp. TRM 82003]
MIAVPAPRALRGSARSGGALELRARRAEYRGVETTPGAAQDALLAELPALTAGPVTLDGVLGAVVDRLAPVGVVSGATARSLEERGRGGTSVGAPAGSGATRVRLRLCGEDLGELALAAGDGPPPRPDVVAAVAHHVAVVLGTEVLRRERAFDAAAAAAVRRLFEEGSRAGDVEEAALLLARVTADVFGTEFAAVHVTDGEGVIRAVDGVGVPEGVAELLQRCLVGRPAAESPVWRRAEREGGPVLSEDAARDPRRSGGFVELLGLRSYAAMPLLSAGGPVGMAVCGDVAPGRRWTARERELARQLALEGALVVDSARMRQAERARLAEVTELAHTDHLTGLPNRRALLEALEGACAGAEPAALLLVDLDGFKQVNDTLGHHAGDVLLQQVAARLRAVVPEPGLVARLGGDEFAVLLRGEPGRPVDAGAALAVAHRLERVVAEPVRVDGLDARVSASIGVAPVASGAAAVPGVLRAADEAMYRAKRAGGGSVPACG